MPLQNRAHHCQPSMSSDFKELKKHLDPSFSYIVFKSTNRKNGSKDIQEILKKISPNDAGILGCEHIQNDTEKEYILILKLNSDCEEDCIQQVLRWNLPKYIDLYIYSSRQEIK